MFDLNTTMLFAVHGGGDSGGGVAGAVAGLLGFIEDLVRLSPADIVAKILPGLAVMDNLHPLFVHFPIALLSLFFLLDFGGSLMNKPGLRQGASWFLYCGSLFALMTVVAGLMAAGTVAHGDDVHEIMEHHEHLGISVLVLAIILSFWRVLAKSLIVGAANTLFQIFAAILIGLVVLTADLGGLMVYQYGVAVKPVAQSNQAAAALHEHGTETLGSEPVVPAVGNRPLEPVDLPHQQGHHHQHQHAH